ncbi:MAG: proline dehydrogenase family protein [Terriglobales bacterium]
MLRQLFIGLSESKRIRRMAEHSPMGLRMSRRFVAGTTIENGIAATRAINQQGMSVTLDHLGENVTNAEEAKGSSQSYHQMLGAIRANQLNANVSCKLTHLGFDVDPCLCRELVCGMVTHAARLNNFVRVDMEGSAYTQRTIDLVRELHRSIGDADAVGTVIQSYLHRSERDVEQLCADGIRIRLVKGAYKEPPEIAFQKKHEVDANFLRLMKILLKSGLYHAIATHDERIIKDTIRFAGQEKISPDSFEFQMLYGIRRDLQAQLVREGWRMRVYIPFGTEWYPYFMRRLAERPAGKQQVPRAKGGRSE